MEELDLEQLKDKYWNIYRTTIEDGKVFIWRELSRGEWNRAVSRFPDDLEREDYILKVCMLSPDPSSFDYENSKAGIITTIVQQILDESGFGLASTNKIEYLTEKFDEEMNTFQHQVSCIITEAFPNLDLEEVEFWPLEKTLWYYSRAKYKLESLRQIELVSSSEETDVSSGPSKHQVASGSGADFPELAAEKAFMSGKLI